MATSVIVFDLGEPRQRLMSWFLTDSGVEHLRLTAMTDVVEALRDPAMRVVVVNSRARPEEIQAIVAELRAISRTLRIIVLHDGGDAADHQFIDADACVHDVGDPDALVATVRAAIADDIPDEEPHEAAEEISS